VDDEVPVASLLADAIQLQGHQTTVVHRGQDALARLGEASYDAVFLDVLMPGMSGVELLRGIRAAHPALPVVVITGHAREEELDELRRLGVSEVIEKPFVLNNLGDALAGLRQGQ
jgi:CheY-like chemotaxis protein